MNEKINKCRWTNRKKNQFNKKRDLKFIIWPAKFNSNTHPFNFPTTASCNFASPHPHPPPRTKNNKQNKTKGQKQEQTK